MSGNEKKIEFGSLCETPFQWQHMLLNKAEQYSFNAEKAVKPDSLASLMKLMKLMKGLR